MKRISFGIILILASFTIFSQENTTQEHKQSVAIKFAPAGLAIGKVTFGGEYNFKHRNSITLLAGVPFDKSNTFQLDGKDNPIKSKASSLMAGYRHYLGHKTMSGFYIEPYVKYIKQEANGLIYKELQGQNSYFDTHQTYKGIGVGAQLGVQFIIAKLVTLDFFLLGPEANSSKIYTIATDVTDNLPWSFADSQQVEHDIKENLKDIPVIGDKIEVNVDTNKKTVTAAYSGFIPGIRVGGSIGIRF